MKRREMLFAAVALLLTAPVWAQTMDTIYVATYLEVRPASTKAGAALAAQYERATRADAGNVAVSAFQEIGRANRFVVIESWRDQAAFAAHEKAAHTLEFREKLKAIHNSPYDQRVNHGFAIDTPSTTEGSKAVYVVTHVDVPGPRREEAEVLLKRLSEASRTEPGHVRYDVYQQIDPRTNHFTVFAAWDSRNSFDAYGSAPPSLQFRESLAPMLGALYDERLYQKIK